MIIRISFPWHKLILPSLHPHTRFPPQFPIFLLHHIIPQQTVKHTISLTPIHISHLFPKPTLRFDPHHLDHLLFYGPWKITGVSTTSPRAGREFPTVILSRYLKLCPGSLQTTQASAATLLSTISIAHRCTLTPTQLFVLLSITPPLYSQSSILPRLTFGNTTSLITPTSQILTHLLPPSLQPTRLPPPNFSETS